MERGKPMDDKLLALLLKDPDKGIEFVMRNYMALVYKIVEGKLSYREDIEECVSNIFYEVYKNRDRIDLLKGSLQGYIGTLAKRKAIDYYRSNTKDMGKVVSLEYYQGEAIDIDTNNKDKYIDKETRSQIIESINKLGEPDREIFIRKYYLGESTKEIAKELNIKENTIDKKVSRGLEKLKKLLGEVF
jgi:RNA polymerase sigma-70 factor, ECF subfamily